MHMINKITGQGYFDQNILMQFILTVRKSYRPNPYHNFEHGFHVCHSMMIILSRNMDLFSDVEVSYIMQIFFLQAHFSNYSKVGRL